VGRRQEHKTLLNVGHDPTTFGEARHQGGERVVAKDKVGGLPGHWCPAAHGHSDVRPLEGRSVVDPIAGDRDRPPGASGGFDEPEFLLGRRPGDDGQAGQLSSHGVVVHRVEIRSQHGVIHVQAGSLGDRASSCRVIAGHDDGLDSGTPGHAEGLGDTRAQLIRETQQGPGLPVPVVGPACEEQQPTTRPGSLFGGAPPALGDALIDHRQDRLWRSERSLLDRPVELRTRPRVGLSFGWTARLEQVRGIEAA
jgi:hypothetical protein